MTLCKFKGQGCYATKPTLYIAQDSDAALYSNFVKKQFLILYNP